MTTKSKIILGCAILLFLTGLLSGMKIHSLYISRNTVESTPDTVYIEKVIDIPYPTLTGKVRDSSSLSIPKKDVKVSKDSTSVDIQKEIATYKDSLPSGISYTATVTGIQPVLSSLKFTVPERRITQTVYKPPEGWSLSAFANAAYSFPMQSVSGGVSLSYCIGAFDFHVDVGAQRMKTQGLSPVTTPYVGVGARVTFLRFKR